MVIGQTISGLGDWMGTFAFMALALNVSDSSSAVGGILTLRLLPAAVGGTMASRIVAKLGRKRVMIAADILRAAIIAIVPLVSQLWWVYVWAFCLEGVSIVFVAARDSSVPDLTEEENLPTANAIILGTSYGSIPVGAGLFAALSTISLGSVAWFNTHDLALVFWVDALTFLGSAFFISRIHTLVRNKARIQQLQESTPHLRLRDGIRVPLIRQVMPSVIAVAVGLGCLFSLGIALIREELGASDVEFGIMILLFGVGAVAGLLATRKMNKDYPRIMKNGALAMGAVVGVMSMSPYLWGTFLGAVGFGIGATITLTAGMSTLQAHLQEHERVLAFGIFHAVIRVALGASAVIAGALGDVLQSVPVGWDRQLAGTRLVLLASGVLVFLTAWFTSTHLPKKSS